MAYDPRKPRKNPELPGIVRAFESNFKDFKAARSPTQRRGYVMVMRALLEQYLDEPDTLTDLLEGPAEETARARLDPDSLGWDRSPGETDPFAQAELGPEPYFFYTAGGRYSNLYPEPAQDPYYVPGLWNHGFFVHTLEKIYATPQPTTHRVVDEEVYKRLVKPVRGGERPFFLLADPAGIEGGHRVVNVKAYKEIGAAVKQADRLGQMLGIRFLVARVVITNCTR